MPGSKRTKPHWDPAIRVLAGLCVCWLTCGAALCQTGTQREYEIKQGALYKIIQHVEWPGNSISNLPPVIQIGLLGEIPFVEALEVLQGKTLKNRKLLIKRVTEAEVPACQVVFIGASEKRRIGEILNDLGDRPVLTVSEVEGFPQNGGMVNLLAEGNHVSMEINPRAATRVGLNISSQLLSRAKLYSR